MQTGETTSHRAFVTLGPRHGELRRLPVAAMRRDNDDRDTAILRVEACALSATDGEQWVGDLPAPWPHVPGSEVVGTIEQIGDRAAGRLGVGVGDRVVVAPRRWCATCPPCRLGRIRRCDRFAAAPSIGQARLGEGDPADGGADAFGGMGELVRLGPGAQVALVPPTLDAVVASGANAIAEAQRWMTGLGEVAPGDAVAILGPGFRGLAAAAAARDSGAAFVAVIGRGPSDASRLELARAFGADLTLDAATTDPVDALHRATGGGADVVLDITASAPDAFAAAIALAAPDGRVVVAGVHGDHDVPGFRPDELVLRQLRVVGAIGCGPGDHARAVGLLASRRWPFASVPTRVVDLTHAAEALDAVAPSTPRAPSAPIRTVIVPGDDQPEQRGDR